MELTVIESRVLRALKSRKGFVLAPELADSAKVDYGALMSVCAGLEQRDLVKAKRSELLLLEPTAEGRTYAKTGSPEKRLADAVAKAKAVSLEDAFEKAGLLPAERPIALKWAKQRKWIEFATGNVSANKHADGGVDEALKLLAKGKTDFSKEVADELVSRRLAVAKSEKSVELMITEAGSQAVSIEGQSENEVTRLTSEMLKTGSWKKAAFKEYDVSTVLAPVSIGLRQHYKRLLHHVKEELVGLGFKEVHGPLVETEFWNMDALFMAQDHPAREIHDAFQLEEPCKGTVNDKALLARVKKAHEEGIAGSIGWRYEWNSDTAHRLVCRSQNTGVSARNLAKGLETPARLFSIGKVFRPDVIDWKHFIEFTQCEGIVADENMNFRELLGYLKSFAIEIFGADDARFYPTYFPFTEPSVEMYAKIGERGWVEVGGAGVFRPEMLEALGVNIPVIAWGLGIDRLAMIRLGLDDMRDLNSSDLEFLKKRAAVL